MNVDAAIAGVPKRTTETLMKMWTNAVRQRSALREDDPNAAGFERFILAVEAEWARRWTDALGKGASTRGPLDPFPEEAREARERAKQDGSDEAKGLITRMGYKVGGTAKGVTLAHRRAILRRFIEGVLPPIERFGVLEQWGEPMTAERWGNVTGFLDQNVKRRFYYEFGGRESATHEWRDDLAFLDETYAVQGSTVIARGA